MNLESSLSSAYQDKSRAIPVYMKFKKKKKDINWPLIWLAFYTTGGNLNI